MRRLTVLKIEVYYNLAGTDSKVRRKSMVQSTFGGLQAALKCCTPEIQTRSAAIYRHLRPKAATSNWGLRLK